MTWGEWIDTDYNTDGWHIHCFGGPFEVCDGHDHTLNDSNGDWVDESYEIIDGESYYFSDARNWGGLN